MRAGAAMATGTSGAPVGFAIDGDLLAELAQAATPED
jgi:hypothetical protein